MKKDQIIPLIPSNRQNNNDHLPELLRLLNELPANKATPSLEEQEKLFETQTYDYKQIREERRKQLKDLFNSFKTPIDKDLVPRKKLPPMVNVGNRKLVFGIGVNDAPYSVHATKGVKECPYYTRWVGMLKNSYHEGNTQCTDIVCERWLSFMSFRRWMKKQDYKGKVLTNKLHSPNCNRYVSEMCCFAPRYVFPFANLTESHIKERLAKGVIESRRVSDGYRVFMHLTGNKDKFLGNTLFLEDAIELHNESLALYIKGLIKEDTHPHIERAFKLSIKNLMSYTHAV